MSDSKTPSSARLEETDLLRVRHLLGGLLMLVAYWGLALVDNASPTLTILSVFAVLAGFAAPGWFASRGDRFWSFAGWAVVVGALGDMTASVVTDRSQLVPSVIRAALYISVLRVLQPRTRREDMQLILLALFLSAIGGALSLSVAFAAQVFLFIPISGGILFLLNRADGATRTKLSGEDWKGVRPGVFLSRIRASLTPATLLFLGGAMVAVVLAGAVIFKTLPRYRLDRALPFLQLPGKGRTGFSDSVSLGGVGSVLQDETVALRADTPERRRPAANPYWRMIALDAYTGGEASCGFALSASAEQFFRRGDGRGAEWADSGGAWAGASVAPLGGEWRLFYEGDVSKYLPVPGLARRIRFDKPQEWQEGRPLRTVRLQQQPSAGVPMLLSVGADSAFFPPAPGELDRVGRGGGREYPATLSQLPDDEASRVALETCVKEMGLVSASTEEFVSKATAWLHRRHAYALQDGYGRKTAPVGEPRDYLVRWMRSEATGWCEHFATSFVLLARAAGHPARLVTGFSGGEWQADDRYLIVRMKHGHAWAEVFDRKANLWRRVDPTPVGNGGANTPAALSGIATFGGLGAWYDGLTMVWFRQVVNFDEVEQRQSAREAFAALKAWGREFSVRAKGWRESLDRIFSDLAATPARLAGPVALVTFTLAAFVAILRWLRARAMRGVRRARDGDPRVRRFRERAGRALVRLDRSAASGRPVDGAVRRAVETVRFGKPADWPDPEAALSAVRPALRAAKSRR